MYTIDQGSISRYLLTLKRRSGTSDIDSNDGVQINDDAQEPQGGTSMSNISWSKAGASKGLPRYLY